jgi:hypothetical protein
MFAPVGPAPRRVIVSALVLVTSSIVLWAGPTAAVAASPHTAGAEAAAPPNGKAPHALPVAATKAGSAHGIVQTVASTAIVVTELDGSSVTVPVAHSTRVFVDGRRASLQDVRAGFVASASWKGGKAARELQAFAPTAQVAVVHSVSRHTVVVTDADGKTLTIHPAAKTRVLVDGVPANLAAVKPGDSLVLPADPASPAELRFLRQG